MAKRQNAKLIRPSFANDIYQVVTLIVFDQTEERKIKLIDDTRNKDTNKFYSE